MQPFIQKPGVLAKVRKGSGRRLIKLRDKSDLRHRREPWEAVTVQDHSLGRENNRYPIQHVCFGNEIVLLIEASTHNFEPGWVVLFEEQTWFIWNSGILPYHAKQ
jgi:hypothetical protein